MALNCLKIKLKVQFNIIIFLIKIYTKILNLKNKLFIKNSVF